MSKDEVVVVFRIFNRFRMINEHIECKNLLESLIQQVNTTTGAARVGAAFACFNYIKEKHTQEIAEAVFAKLVEMGHFPNHKLSTYEGFLEAFVSEMSSGAAFGGAFSGAGDNATINATGMAGIDNPLGSKKRKIDKILTRNL